MSVPLEYGIEPRRNPLCLISGVPGVVGALFFYPGFLFDIPRYPMLWICAFTLWNFFTAVVLYVVMVTPTRKKIRIGFLIDFLWFLAIVVTGRIFMMPIGIFVWVYETFGS